MNAEESGLNMSDHDPFLWGFQNRLSGEEPISPSGGNQQQTQGGRVQKTRGKKKLPVPDLDAINDLAERRRQRRLIKNRNTAAASRCVAYKARPYMC